MIRLLRNWPAEFWAALQEFLQAILEFLISNSLDLRLQAARLISAFASAKLELLSTEENDFLPLSETVQSFTEKDPKDKKPWQVWKGRRSVDEGMEDWE